MQSYIDAEFIEEWKKVEDIVKFNSVREMEISRAIARHIFTSQRMKLATLELDNRALKREIDGISKMWEMQ